MFGLLKRMTKFSLNLLTKVLELPFLLIEFVHIVLNAAAVGAMGGGVVLLFCRWQDLDPYLVALPWAVGLGLLQFARNIHAVYVRGEAIG